MPNRWITITEDTLKAEGYGEIIDEARVQAVGDADPVTEKIADAVARVRRAVSTGNVLDADPATVPASLRDLTARYAIFALMDRLQLALSQDQRDTRKADRGELNRISDEKIKVERPDHAEGESTIVETGLKIEAVGVPPRLTGRERTKGL